MAIEIVDLPMNSIVDLSSSQTVSLQEGHHDGSYQTLKKKTSTINQFTTIVIT